MDDNVIQPPAQVETIPIPPTPPPRKNYSVVLIVILVILIGILVGMELDETTLIANFRARFLRPTPTPNVHITPSPSPDPTAGWKTYTNTAGDYSIKYPATATIEAAQKPSVSISFMGQEQVQSGRTQTELFDGYKVTVSSEQIAPGQTAQSAALYQNKNVINGCPAPEVAKVSGVETAKISGLTAYHYTIMNCLGDYDMYLVQNSNTIYSINLLYTASTASQKDAYYQTATQILSTFKFVDQTPTPTCRPRPACLDATPRCLMPETADMCPPSPKPTSTTFTCPPNGWVDCMPGPAVKPECSAEAMAWYQANCPDFKGGAL